MSDIHVCKSWTHFFQAIKNGDKKHDVRGMNDRDFKVGDMIQLHEYDNIKGEFTGDICNVYITYITSNVTPCAFSSAVLDKDYCILSLELEK